MINDYKTRLELLESKISKRKKLMNSAMVVFVVICISIYMIIGVSI